MTGKPAGQAATAAEIRWRVEQAHGEELRRAANAHAARMRAEDTRLAAELAGIEERYEASLAATGEPAPRSATPPLPRLPANPYQTEGKSSGQ
jgi:hypothetical protein